jgi:hypothetical protein
MFKAGIKMWALVKTWPLIKPFAKRRTRKRIERVGETAREIAMSVVTNAPRIARALESIAPPPKRKRVAPKKVAAAAVLGTGAAAGAAAGYFLKTEGGRERRRQLRRSVR